MRTTVPAVCAIGIAAVAGWMLAGGNLPSGESVFGQTEPVAVPSSSGSSVHIASSPSGAQVHIDGQNSGETPLDVRLLPGQHRLSLRHPDNLDDEQTLQVTETAATVNIGLWRRRPDVVMLRPIYPGASLLDARFLNDGQVALLVGLPSHTGAATTGRELWRLDPATGQLARVAIPGMDNAASSLVLSPDSDRVAYVTPGSSPPGSSPSVTATGWSTAPSTSTTQKQANEPESVWLAPLDGAQPPQRIFELPSVSTPATAASSEHIVDLVWTPNGSQGVAITRQTGPSVRARVILLNVAAAIDAHNQAPDANELVFLPAEVLPDSAVPDPRGRWLALVTHAASGGNTLVSLCVLELRPGGAFRDLADLGAAPGAAAASVAWPPAAETNAPDRLVFVGPAPAAASGSGGPFGVFGIFGTLRPSAPPSGLFMADLQAAGLEGTQPRRLGTAINNFGLVWHFQTTLFGFAREADGTLSLHSIDPTSGAVRDMGVRLPAGTAQGIGGLSARWDARHGFALLLAHVSADGTFGASAGRSPLQAWLVSFVSASAQPGPAH
ncbi:MAG: PEGA domain-containing protein [Chloroflexota bacterium]|nr:PEGA domain-containing protein [Chloroflexota bacterium]